MGRIIISENVSLDGVVEDPAGDEGFERGGWVGPIKNRPELNQVALNEALDAGAFLLGRRSYEWFAARWSSRTGELADRLNSMPKYVVSSTLGDVDWSNSTVLRGDPVEEVSRLKQELDGEIVVPASFQLARMLMERELVGELRLKVHPVVLGAGGVSSATQATRNHCASSPARPSTARLRTSSTKSFAAPDELLRHVDRSRRRLPGHRRSGTGREGGKKTKAGSSTSCSSAVPPSTPRKTSPSRCTPCCTTSHRMLGSMPAGSWVTFR